MNLSDLVELYFEEVQRAPSLDDDEIERRLVAAGADVPTARRIITFAPFASARVWYRDAPVSFSATFRWFGNPDADSFVQTALDPIHAALAPKSRGAGEVGWQSLDKKGWSVCRGRVFGQGQQQPAADTRELWTRWFEQLPATEARPKLHAIRWHRGTGHDSAVLLDGEPWPEGKAALVDWPDEADRGVKNFDTQRGKSIPVPAFSDES